MTVRSTAWLIQALGERLREPVYLHVFEGASGDGERLSIDRLEWMPERTRALRFATKGDAERFGLDRLLRSFLVSEHPLADLVLAADEPADDEDLGQEIFHLA